MNEKMGVDDFLEGGLAEDRPLLATIEADPQSQDVVIVTPWSESGAGCGCSYRIPKDNIEGVRPTEHRVRALRVVELILKDDATVPTRDLLGGILEPTMPRASGRWIDRFDVDASYYGWLDEECYGRVYQWCLDSNGVHAWRYCQRQARSVCTREPQFQLR
jgi:hypothetical protein